MVKIAIIICTRNRAAKLQTTLDTLVRALPQERAGIEVIVVDDGSTEQTAAALQALRDKWGPKLEVFRQTFIVSLSVP